MVLRVIGALVVAGLIAIGITWCLTHFRIKRNKRLNRRG